MPDFSDFFQPSGFGFNLVTNIRKSNSVRGGVYDNLTPENVRKAVTHQKITTDRYVLLYFYARNDELSVQFLREYGARLNNRLKAELPLFTVYPETVLEEWKSSGSLNESARMALDEEFRKTEDPAPQYQLLLELAILYKALDAVPALVVIDGKSYGNVKEAFTCVSLKSLTDPKAMFGKMCAVLDAIEANPNNFKAVCDACNTKMCIGQNSLAERLAEVDPGSLYRFFKAYIDKKRSTIEECAKSCGMSRNTLSDYMYEKRRIKLENLFALAFYLGLSTDELDRLVINHSTASGDEKRAWGFGGNRRFNAIKELLKQKTHYTEVNDRLHEMGYAINEPLEKGLNNFD